jgi:transposase
MLNLVNKPETDKIMPTTEQLQTAATMTVQGASLRDIASATGVSHVSVHQWKKKDEFNQLIKEAQTKLIKDSLMNAVESQSLKIKAGKDIAQRIADCKEIANGAVKLMELGHDSEKQLLQSIGIHNAHTQSIQVNNILVDNRQELSPAVARLISQHFAKVEGDTIDI